MSRAEVCWARHDGLPVKLVARSSLAKPLTGVLIDSVASHATSGDRQKNTSRCHSRFDEVRPSLEAYSNLWRGVISLEVRILRSTPASRHRVSRRSAVFLPDMVGPERHCAFHSATHLPPQFIPFRSAACLTPCPDNQYEQRTRLTNGHLEQFLLDVRMRVIPQTTRVMILTAVRWLNRLVRKAALSRINLE